LDTAQVTKPGKNELTLRQMAGGRKVMPFTLAMVAIAIVIVILYD
jgi:hypothetical protein